MNKKPRYVTTVKCPYCKNKFPQFFEATIYKHNNPPLLSIGTQDYKVVLCDNMDTPGCDRYFVVRPTISINTTSHAIVDFIGE